MSDAHLFLAVWVVSILLIWPPWLWWVVSSRRAEGHQMMPQVPADALYAEKQGSGGESGKLAGATNCLLIAVTPDEFVVTPTFPFNLIGPPRGPFGLVHKVARGSVRASEHQSWRGNVRVEITGPTTVLLDLKLREPKRFLEALKLP